MSGETKFTPGPWGAASKPSSVVGWPIVAPRAMGRMICNVSFIAHSDRNPAVPGDRAFNAESKANAHLIAASPELYTALEQAEYAIGNASGVSEREFSRPLDYEDFRVWAEQWIETAREALRKARGESQ